jgi:hypothetical protein
LPLAEKWNHQAEHEAFGIMRTLSARQVIDSDVFDPFVACGAWRDDTVQGGDAVVQACVTPEPGPH